MMHVCMMYVCMMYVCMYIHMMYIHTKDIAKIKCASSDVATPPRLPPTSRLFLPKRLSTRGLLFESSSSKETYECMEVHVMYAAACLWNVATPYARVYEPAHLTLCVDPPLFKSTHSLSHTHTYASLRRLVGQQCAFVRDMIQSCLWDVTHWYVSGNSCVR